MSVFVGIAQRVDDEAAAVLYGIDGLVRVPRNPAVKARHVNLVDEIGVERRVGIGRRDANRVRQKMGEHEGCARWRNGSIKPSWALKRAM